MNKVHVIVNPFSARGKTQERWGIIKDIISHYFKEYKYIFTEKPKQATQIVNELLKDGFDLIIGVGGDGTLNEITNGYFQEGSHKAVNDDASLGIIPSGTGSDFIRFLKIPRDFRQSVELIKNSTITRMDVGKITFGVPNNNDTSTSSSKYFINIADFGLGAEVVKKLSLNTSGKRGPMDYYKGLLSTIRNYKSKEVRIVLDDSEEITGRYLIGAVANGRMFGGGMIIAPEASPNDGYFDLVLVEDMGKFEIVRNSIKLYNGSIQRHPKVTVRKVRKVQVYCDIDSNSDSNSDQEVNIEYDGELGKTLPAKFEVIEKSLNFRV
jgi:diacylglycerol kinase (ATP)